MFVCHFDQRQITLAITGPEANRADGSRFLPKKVYFGILYSCQTKHYNVLKNCVVKVMVRDL